MKKIDIHCHTTRRALKEAAVEDASVQHITKLMQKYDIEKTVLLATYFSHRGSGITNFRLSHWIENREEFAMFGSFDFQHYFFQGLNEVKELAEEKKIKGIKIYTCYQDIDLKSEKFGEVISLSSKFQLPLMFHCGYSYQAMRTSSKPSIASMVQASDLEHIANLVPHLPVIVCHMSKPYTDDLISTVKRNDNIYTDMSGLIDSKYDRKDIPECIEEIKKFLYECGPRKLLFGTDFPIQTHQDPVHFIEESMKKFSLVDKEDVYYNNSWRILHG